MVEAAARPTEFPFTLPYGYNGPDGVIHREGTMRLATAFDEIAPLKDPRVQANPGYLVIILLSRVITRLGALEFMNPKVVEGLLSGDLVYLQELYRRINENGHARLLVACPHCQGEFEVETASVGEA
jgi:hypothetical protein